MVLGIQKKDTIFHSYIGEWIIVYPQHASTFSGRLERIEGDYLVLNPHQGGKYDMEKGLRRVLEEKPAIVRISDIVAIEPTSRESIETYCKLYNRFSRNDFEKALSESYNKK